MAKPKLGLAPPVGIRTNSSIRLAMAQAMDEAITEIQSIQDDARFRAEFAELAPQGDRRMSANPHANGGLLLRALSCSTSTPSG